VAIKVLVVYAVGEKPVNVDKISDKLLSHTVKPAVVTTSIKLQSNQL